METGEKLSRFRMVKERHGRTFASALLQGKVDPQMQSLCGFLAGTRGFYTSSCCSGRILLLEKRGDSKKENFFHRKWHREVLLQELLEGAGEEVKGELWFKVEPFILHVGCPDIAGARKVLGAMKRAGVKRGGIIIAEDGKFLVELQGTERMSFPLGGNGGEVVGSEYLAWVLPKANRMISRNYARLAKLEAEFRKNLC